MGPPSAYSGCRSGPDCTALPQRHRAASPPRRRCLLKGCEAWFRSPYALARYCSQACRQAARRWSQWQANQCYRQSAQGQQRRRQPCQRRRERQRPDSPAGSQSADSSRREGYHKADEREKNPCHRPGCYECFASTPRSPLKKFCSQLCRQALRQVLQREARWRQRWRQRGLSFRDPLFSKCLSRRI